jgi:succinate-semialdehyde dehydrogenase/glutarate-semialdehyde dehydrogenase
MTYRTINPATGQLLKTFDELNAEEVEACLARAHGIFQSDWSQGPISTRLSVLENLAQVLSDNADEIAKTMAIEMGKPLKQGVGEVKLCVAIAEYYAKNAEEFLRPSEIETSLGKAWVEYHPIGVLIAVEPWNFPIYQLIRVVAPAISVGNPVLIKHAGIVPQCAALFESLVLKAGAPKGVCTNLYISSDQVAALIADARVQGAALTGSEKAGAAVAAAASRALKKSTLELGGNDVFIVLDDANVAQAAKIGAQARLANAGQVCTAAKRFIVHEAVADAFTEAFTEHLKSAVIGDPLAQTTTMGPLSSEEAAKGLTTQVEAAVANGAHLIFGGKRVDRDGFFFEPGILINITRDNPAYYEEFFGPIAQLYSVSSDDQIIALANDSHFGLGGSIFTADVERAKSLASRIETGMVFINAATTSAPELPFGGVKHSGFGRELGDSGIMEFVNKKLVVIQT